MRNLLIERLYLILKNHEVNNGYFYLSHSIPKNFSCGIYFFFDTINSILVNQFKITYIGITKNNKNNRLKKHQKNGPSSFRDHIGEAFKNKVGETNNLSLDLLVDKYIEGLPYLFIRIDDINTLELIEKKND